MTRMAKANEMAKRLREGRIRSPKEILDEVNPIVIKSNGKKKFEYDYPMPSIAADVVLFVKDGAQAKQVLLIQRGNEPFKGCWALPGGYINIDEEPIDAAAREVEEETGIKINPKSLYPAGTYTNPTRDPRGRVISFAFFGIQHRSAMPDIKGMDDAADARLVDIMDIANGKTKLAFDHKQIFDDAISRYRNAGGI